MQMLERAAMKFLEPLSTNPQTPHLVAGVAVVRTPLLTSTAIARSGCCATPLPQQFGVFARSNSERASQSDSWLDEPSRAETARQLLWLGFEQNAQVLQAEECI